jgi:dCTP deaminase
MAFWSSQTLGERIGQLIDPPDPTMIDCNAITLRVGTEIYITPELEQAHTQTKQSLRNNQGFLIPPGQFAFLMTEEIVRVYHRTQWPSYRGEVLSLLEKGLGCTLA